MILILLLHLYFNAENKNEIIIYKLNLHTYLQIDNNVHSKLYIIEYIYDL